MGHSSVISFVHHAVPFFTVCTPAWCEMGLLGPQNMEPNMDLETLSVVIPAN